MVIGFKYSKIEHLKQLGHRITQVRRGRGGAMKVSDLIEVLKLMPPTATVGYVYDGHVRGSADLAWLSRGGEVVLSGYNEVLYGNDERPVDAPTEKEDRYWRTPRGPEV
jgi:hypothetical protein